MHLQEQVSEEQLKFPIGPLPRKEDYASDDIASLIQEIADAPAQYADVARDLSDADLEKCYRPGSWNIRQLIHHVSDIQMLHFFRMKKAMTDDDKDTIIISMDGWAATPDSISETIADSLEILPAVTKRYVYLMKSLTPEQLRLKYYHPVRKYDISLAQAIQMSAWHLHHHLAHIQIALGKFQFGGNGQNS